MDPEGVRAGRTHGHGQSLPEGPDSSVVGRAPAPTGYVCAVTDPTSLPPMPDFAPDGGPGSGEVSGPLRGRVLDALLDEGYRPDIDDDGDVAVRVQGQQMFVRCLETVPPLMRVFGQWMMGEDVPGDELVRLRATNSVVGALNLIKATVVEDRLVVAVDLVVNDATELRSLLSATIEAVLGSVQMWHATVLELYTAATGEPWNREGPGGLPRRS
jgi:T3SS (YopN, CesT) and YbjN peptide-binding chaperone 1